MSFYNIVFIWTMLEVVLVANFQLAWSELRGLLTGLVVELPLDLPQKHQGLPF